MSTVMDKPMSKQRKDVPARVSEEALAEAKIAASIKRMSLVEYLSEIVLDTSRRVIEDEMRRRAKPKKSD